MIAVLLATGCDRKLTTSLQHVVFEGDSIRVHFQHTETYDYLPVSLCMHGCKPDVRKVRFGQAWRPATPEGEWRYVEGGDASISSPEVMVSSLRGSGLVRWRGDAPACPGFYAAHGVPEVVDCQRSTFRVASNDARLTPWDAHLTGPWRGEPNTAPHGLLIEADARQRRSVDPLPRRWRTAQAQGYAAAIAARDAVARAAGDHGSLDEQSVLARCGCVTGARMGGSASVTCPARPWPWMSPAHACWWPGRMAASAGPASARRTSPSNCTISKAVRNRSSRGPCSPYSEPCGPGPRYPATCQLTAMAAWLAVATRNGLKVQHRRHTLPADIEARPHASTGPLAMAVAVGAEADRR